jgi:hypothetical protein
MLLLQWLYVQNLVFNLKRHGEPVDVWLIIMQRSLLYTASYGMHMKHLVLEMYYTSHYDVLCGLCEQEGQAELAGEGTSRE